MTERVLERFWAAVREAAVQVALQGNPDEAEPAAAEDVTTAGARVAGAVFEGGGVAVEAVSLSRWTLLAVNDLRPLVERAVTALVEGARAEGDEPASLDEALAPIAGLFDAFASAVGAAVGQLARRSLLHHELWLPRPGDTLRVPAGNVRAFAAVWTLDPSEAARACVATDLLRHRALRRPEVAERLEELCVRHLSGFSGDVESALMSSRAADGSWDLPRLLAALRTPEQVQISTELAALIKALDEEVDRGADGVAGVSPRIAEARRRRTLEMPRREHLLDFALGLPSGNS